MAMVPPRWLIQVPDSERNSSPMSSMVSGVYSASRPSTAASSAKLTPVSR